MNELPEQHCKGCGRMIVMRPHYKTGNLAPITAYAPDGVWEGKGNIVVLETGHYRLIKTGEEYDGTLYLNHFLDCPAAKRFKRH